MNDVKFMTHIISEICNYAVKNNMVVDDTLETIAKNILMALQVSTFNKWKLEQEEVDE